MAEPISYNARLTELARAKPDAPAVSFGDETLSWAGLRARVDRLARGMAAFGVREGDMVTLGLPNGVGFIEVCWACWALGATPQPVSARLPKAELEAIVALADPPIVVAENDLALDRPRLSVAELMARGAEYDGESVESLPDRVAPSWKAPTSGGSTGRPKLIVAGQPSLYDPDAPAGWRVLPDDVALMPGPLYHNGPLASSLTAMLAGAHLVVMPRFDAEGVLAEVQRRRATWLYLVPTMMGRIWRLPPEVRARYDVSSLRTVWHLAAPCPPWLKEAWIEWLGPETIMELYAGTEAQAVTTIDGAEWLQRRGSVGKVSAGEMKVLGSDGQELAPGEIGEIYMRRGEGAAPTYRYVGAEARSQGDWESLGDIGWFDADGYLYLADRRSDMILVGGANIFPAEIEAALDEHPLVVSSAVIGLPDEDLGNRVHAIVQAPPELDLEDLKAHLAERLVIYKQPRSLERVEHPLRDDAGKIRRSQLRAERVGG